MDVWGPALVRGQGHERYFLLVVDDYSRYTTVFPLRSKGEVPETFTLPTSPQQNGIAEHRIGMVMDVTRTSMIHAVAPHFLWPFAVQYAAHQINLQPRVSLPETTPTLRWTRKVGKASAFHVWGSRAFVRDTSADKLSSRAVDLAEPVEVAVDSGAARGAEPAGARTGVAEPGGAEPEHVESWGAEPAGAGAGGAESGGAEPERVEPGGTASWGAGPARAEAGGSPSVPLRRKPLSPRRLREWYAWRCCHAAGAAGAGAAGGAAGAGAAGGAAGAGAAGGASGAGATGAAAGAGATGGAAAAEAAGGAACAGAAGGAAGAGAAGAAGPGGARTGGTGAARTGGASGVGAAGTGAGGTAGVVTRDLGAEGTCAVSAVSGGAARPWPYYTRGLTERCEPESRPVSLDSRPALLESRSMSPVHTVCAGRRVSRPRPPIPDTHSMTLRPSTAPQRVPLPSPPASSLPDGPDLESDSLRPASPAVSRFMATAVTDPLSESTAASALLAELVDFAATCRLDYAISLVAESASASVCPPSVGGECALGTNVLENREEEFECFAATVPHLVSMLLAPEGELDAPDIPTPRSYSEAIEGPYSSHWQAAMDAEMASWKSTGTYDDEVPPPRANIVSGIWIFRVKQPPGSPPVFKARYVARGFTPPSDESVEPSGPYPELVGCLMYLMTCTRPDLAYPLSLLAHYVAPGRHRKVHWDAAKRVLRYLCSTSGMGLVLGGWGPVVLTGHADASWVDDLATQRSSQGYTFSLGSGSVSLQSTRSSSILSSSCEAEIYAGAMAAQEFR
ncbi:unnamed protein product [Closterium sp. NIES-54]